jgi:hypothetical protein
LPHPGAAAIPSERQVRRRGMGSHGEDGRCESGAERGMGKSLRTQEGETALGVPAGWTGLVLWPRRSFCHLRHDEDEPGSSKTRNRPNCRIIGQGNILPVFAPVRGACDF